MKEKSADTSVEKSANAIADFIKHVGGKKASADTPKASGEAQDSGKTSDAAFGENGGGGAF